MSVSEWFKGYKKDFITKEFIPLKLLAVLILGGEINHNG